MINLRSKLIIIVVLILSIVSTAAFASTSVSITEPVDGAKISGPVKVCLATSGVTVEPAKKGVHEGSGHHHLLLDVDIPGDLSKPISKDAKHVHMGDGSTCKKLNLAAGKHTIRALFAKGNHVPYDPTLTDKVTIECDQIIVGVGPLLRDIWNMLDLPKEINIKDDKGQMHENYPMWKYWFLTEGVLGVDPKTQLTNDGKMPPVIHIDTDAPLYSDEDKSLITDKLWGIYYKPDFHFNGIQGGSSPYKVDAPADNVNVDPYGPDSSEYVVGSDFAHMWSSALAFCQKRFEGKSHLYKKGSTGGLGCFTPDNFPIFDKFRENVHIIADSNHGYKMIGVGKLVASELLGENSKLLEPFRFSRFKEGKLHPISNSPFPWS